MLFKKILLNQCTRRDEHPHRRPGEEHLRPHDSGRRGGVRRREQIRRCVRNSLIRTESRRSDKCMSVLVSEESPYISGASCDL
ncbi:hypothetical protein KOW79_008768 [Hemibagrus wyckioides]|uniref:Uncharacterized protein n=1 Tax=Hemibagrus wyckioides TaxID=337641 RepID=A0A9D3NRV2_9TELE|nr:hypothetical protein KOW79_008768 [Hemibagrus wyckioides]